MTSEAKTEVSFCKECSDDCLLSEFPTLDRLEAHIREQHLQWAAFGCGNCRDEFYGMEAVTDHHNQMHQNSQFKIVHNLNIEHTKEFEKYVGSTAPPISAKIFRCKKCFLDESVVDFASISDLESHIRAVHIQWSPFRCFWCSVAGSGRDELIPHTKIAHPLLSLKIEETIDDEKSKEISNLVLIDPSPDLTPDSKKLLSNPEESPELTAPMSPEEILIVRNTYEEDGDESPPNKKQKCQDDDDAALPTKSTTSSETQYSPFDPFLPNSELSNSESQKGASSSSISNNDQESTKTEAPSLQNVFSFGSSQVTVTSNEQKQNGNHAQIIRAKSQSTPEQQRKLAAHLLNTPPKPSGAKIHHTQPAMRGSRGSLWDRNRHLNQQQRMRWKSIQMAAKEKANAINHRWRNYIDQSTLPRVPHSESTGYRYPDPPLNQSHPGPSVGNASVTSASFRNLTPTQHWHLVAQNRFVADKVSAPNQFYPGGSGYRYPANTSAAQANALFRPWIGAGRLPDTTQEAGSPRYHPLHTHSTPSYSGAQMSNAVPGSVAVQSSASPRESEAMTRPFPQLSTASLSEHRETSEPDNSDPRFPPRQGIRVDQSVPSKGIPLSQANGSSIPWQYQDHQTQHTLHETALQHAPPDPSSPHFCHGCRRMIYRDKRRHTWEHHFPIKEIICCPLSCGHSSRYSITSVREHIQKHHPGINPHSFIDRRPLFEKDFNPIFLQCFPARPGETDEHVLMKHASSLSSQSVSARELSQPASAVSQCQNGNALFDPFRGQHEKIASMGEISKEIKSGSPVTNSTSASHPQWNGYITFPNSAGSEFSRSTVCSHKKQDLPSFSNQSSNHSTSIHTTADQNSRGQFATATHDTLARVPLAQAGELISNRSHPQSISQVPNQMFDPNLRVKSEIVEENHHRNHYDTGISTSNPIRSNRPNPVSDVPTQKSSHSVTESSFTPQRFSTAQSSFVKQEPKDPEETQQCSQSRNHHEANIDRSKLPNNQNHYSSIFPHRPPVDPFPSVHSNSSSTKHPSSVLPPPFVKTEVMETDYSQGGSLVHDEFQQRNLSQPGHTSLNASNTHGNSFEQRHMIGSQFNTYPQPMDKTSIDYCFGCDSIVPRDKRKHVWERHFPIKEIICCPLCPFSARYAITPVRLHIEKIHPEISPLAFIDRRVQYEDDLNRIFQNCFRDPRCIEHSLKVHNSKTGKRPPPSNYSSSMCQDIQGIS